MSAKKFEGLNRVALLGRVVGPVGAVAGGVLRLVLEVTEREKVVEDWVDRSSHISVAVVGRRAASLGELDLDGSKLYVEGPLRSGKTTWYVEARKVILLGGRPEVSSAVPGVVPTADAEPF